MLTPEQENELLKRKLSREKKARQLAEEQLEHYSREIYLANVSLEKNLERTNKRRLELEFLHKTSSLVNSELSITELLKSISAYIAKFVRANVGGYYVASDFLSADDERSRVWTSDEGWHRDTALFNVFNDNIDIKESLDAAQWIIAPLDEATARRCNSRWLLYKNYALDKDSSAIIAFLSNDHSLEEELLYVLDTLNDHLNSGLRRRLADQRIQRRNKQLEETISTLESTQQQLIQSEKMASLGLLSAGVAHEINNPVGYIKANLEVLNEYHSALVDYADTLQQKTSDGVIDHATYAQIQRQFDIPFVLEDTKEILETNLDGIRRVSDIVSGLKTYSHSGDNTQSRMSIPECVDKALKVVGNELKYQHSVENKLADTLPDIIGNAGQLQQVFINLFVNAAHAMPDGGELCIDAEVDSSNNSLNVYISDTGVGMSDEQKNKLFMPFFTTKPVGEGTGLGLSVSLAILEAHNATVSVQSDEGLGTTFIIVFPIP